MQTEEVKQWRPRWYYVMVNKTSGKKYIGQTVILDFYKGNYRGSGPYWVEHCQKHGGHDSQNIEIVFSEWFTDRILAQEWLEYFESKNPEYFESKNHQWANQVRETTADCTFSGMKGVKKTDEQRAKMSVTHSTPEAKAKRSSMMKEVYSRPGMREKLSEVQRLSNARPEVKAKKSAAQKAIAARPGESEKRSQRSKDAVASSEAREKMSVAAKLANARPEVKLKLAKPLFCLETAQFFLSANEAGNALSIPPQTIYNSTIKNKTICKYNLTFRLASPVEKEGILSGEIDYVR